MFCPCAKFSIFWTTGQICTATSRLIVAAPIAQQFFDRLKVHGNCMTACRLELKNLPVGSFCWLMEKPAAALHACSSGCTKCLVLLWQELSPRHMLCADACGADQDRGPVRGGFAPGPARQPAAIRKGHGLHPGALITPCQHTCAVDHW